MVPEVGGSKPLIHPILYLTNTVVGFSVEHYIAVDGSVHPIDGRCFVKSFDVLV